MALEEQEFAGVLLMFQDRSAAKELLMSRLPFTAVRKHPSLGHSSL